MARIPRPLAPLARLVCAAATPLGRGRLMARARGADLFQPATVTWDDRHPALFAAIADHLADIPAPRLLSFGCSTGEEALTLARYLPGSRVDGVDANPACIARARRAAAMAGEAERVRFRCADAPDAFGDGPYDAVLCLSVLRHGDLDRFLPDCSTALMPFARFERAAAALDACVRPGGLLVVWGSHFRLEDSAVAARYRALAVVGVRPQPGPFYGPDDRRLPSSTKVGSMFVRLR